MKCKDCSNAIVDKTQSDKDMAKLGYRTCALSRTPIERATFFRGSQECMWIDRVVIRKGDNP